MLFTDREDLPALGCIGVDFRPWRLSLRAGRAAAALAMGLPWATPSVQAGPGGEPKDTAEERDAASVHPTLGGGSCAA